MNCFITKFKCNSASSERSSKYRRRKAALPGKYVHRSKAEAAELAKMQEMSVQRYLIVQF